MNSSNATIWTPIMKFFEISILIYITNYIERECKLHKGNNESMKRIIYYIKINEIKLIKQKHIWYCSVFIGSYVAEVNQTAKSREKKNNKLFVQRETHKESSFFHIAEVCHKMQRALIIRKYPFRCQQTSDVIMKSFVVIFISIITISRTRIDSLSP